MKFAVIGLGSMGKRRLRCLDTLGYDDVVAYDLDADRRAAVAEEYGIDVVSDVDDLDFDSLDALVVSTPPFAHNEYIELAIEKGVPAFVEASVLKDGLPALSDRAADAGVRIAPSCTMRFHPAIQDISDIVRSGEYGEVTSFSYHFGQYLPDWHPWQDVEDFYVSREDTSATREMVPFELMWLVDVVGYPEAVDGQTGRTTADIGTDIEDAYAMTLDVGTGFGTLMVDVVARHATRRLVLNLEDAQILWSWDDNTVELYEAESERWIEYHQPEGETEKGYNQNIIEDMYVDELSAFIDEVRGEGTFPHTLEEDIRILELLEEVEAP